MACAWFVLAGLSTLYVGIDQYRNNPEPVVMKWGFILVTLYMGPLGLLLYVLADKEPRPGEHEAFIRPLWKQGIGSTIHCVAGDATGIILVAVITALLGLPMWLDLILEYLVSASTVAVGWSGYATDAAAHLGLALPHALSRTWRSPAVA
ncbi:MAG: DUF4396 domain-containing protein, partial [Pseudomonadota bacterium]